MDRYLSKLFLTPFIYRVMQKSRAARLISNSKDVDAIIIQNSSEPFLDSTFWYLTEQSSGVFEGATAIVSKDGSLDVVVSVLEEESAKTGKGNLHIYRTRKEREEAIGEILKGVKDVGVNSDSITFSAVQHLKKINDGITIKDSSKAISDTVAVKDKNEIEAISKACAISSKVANELPGMIYKGVSEKSVAASMDNRMRDLGGTGNAFETIAAFGKYSAEPHHKPSDYKLRIGDTVLFDFGSKYDLYCSDLTRTIFFGDPGDVLKRAYDIVQKAQQAGLEQIRDGASAKDVDLAARKIIDDSEFKGTFIHSFGHGIGMDIHQSIYVASNSDQILRENNIISAEPGIYIPGLGGIRIEDTVLVTKSGYRLLTEYEHGYTSV